MISKNTFEDFESWWASMGCDDEDMMKLVRMGFRAARQQTIEKSCRTCRWNGDDSKVAPCLECNKMYVAWQPLETL